MGQPVKASVRVFKGKRSGFSIAALSSFIDSSRGLSIINFAISSTTQELTK
jgi:hypothetical protein